MAQTGERINRRCPVEMPARFYTDDDAAAVVRCGKGIGHQGPHSATVNRPRTIEWTDGQVHNGGGTDGD